VDVNSTNSSTSNNSIFSFKKNIQNQIDTDSLDSSSESINNHRPISGGNCSGKKFVYILIN
jgi:hypothetical protein